MVRFYFLIIINLFSYFLLFIYLSELYSLLSIFTVSLFNFFRLILLNVYLYNSFLVKFIYLIIYNYNLHYWVLKIWIKIVQDWAFIRVMGFGICLFLNIRYFFYRIITLSTSDSLSHPYFLL